MNEETKTKEFWITNSRFKFIAVVLFLIFLILISFLYLKAEEVTKDPCSICAKRMGEKVLCTTGTVNPITRTYFPNGNISETERGSLDRQKGFDFFVGNLS